MNTNAKLISLLGGATLLTLVGCANDPKPRSAPKNYLQEAKDMDNFPPEDDSRSYRRFMIAQIAAGARHDGMLYDYHFDGDQLNSLGQQKLSVMLKANDHAFPVVIYMNVTDDGLEKSRETAVATYLVDCGLQDNQIHFQAGPNPYARSSASQNLARYQKTESESGVASNPTSPGAPGYGTGGGNAGGDGTASK